MRDIPAPNIVAGVKKSNLRQIVQQRLREQGHRCSCIRCREVRGREVDPESLALQRFAYETDVSRECFLAATTADGLLAGFLRLSPPRETPPLAELEGCAVIREVHVYGPALPLGAREQGLAQHGRVGTRLIAEAKRIAQEAGFEQMAVIAAVGTRPYYARHGFRLRETYMLGSAQAAC